MASLDLHLFKNKILYFEVKLNVIDLIVCCSRVKSTLVVMIWDRQSGSAGSCKCMSISYHRNHGKYLLKAFDWYKRQLHFVLCCCTGFIHMMKVLTHLYLTTSFILEQQNHSGFKQYIITSSRVFSTIEFVN